ncbi:MAG: IclR family transcriptional regulator [Acidimicrobiia bacterium]|nr:IclR family transcriptional regulator [Acidimicrobiia bacterium]MDH5520745.1 IclR family transcriptional regulator [Acidimicrobiia bacterium]
MSDDRQVLSSVTNAARLLKQFSAREREFGVSELARRLGLGKSTVHRLLVTLAEQHLVEQDEVSGKYRLGLAIYDLGAAVATGLDLHEAVMPSMEQLRAATGETVQVAVLDGREVVYIERLDSPNTLRLFLEVGRRNWAHCTGTGKLLMAYLSSYELDRVLEGWELEAVTPHTITDESKLRKELAKVRSQGFAQNLGESEVGVLSVSGPIRDITGRVRAALSVAGPQQRMEPLLDKITLAVQEMAAVASRRLGWRS